MRTLRGSRMVVATHLLSWVLIVLSVGVGACSETARYRALSFFLDGVPKPGTATEQPDAAAQAAQPSQVTSAAPSAPIQRYFAHTPYRENRCAGCHSLQTGGLVREIEAGLCRTCHAELLTRSRFVHGPVAVDGCTECHHHHAAPRENLLLQEGDETCYACHDREEIVVGEYHASVGTEGCTTCHDPHGGADRFFLKSGRETP